MKGIIVCIVILFFLVLAAIIMSAIALATQSSNGNTGFKVTKITTSTGTTDITVSGPMYVQVVAVGNSGTTTVNFTGENGSVALVRNSSSAGITVNLTSSADMYTLSDRTATNSYTLKTNTYALLLWEKGVIFIAPFL